MFARLKAEHDHQRKTCSGISPKTCFCLPNISGAHGCGPRLVRGTRCPLAEYVASLRFQTSASSPKRGGANLNDIRIRPQGLKRSWWSLSGSNRRPEACKATALPAELRPLTIMVGLGRLERPTSPLSGVRSNHLSYRPQSTGPAAQGHPPDRCIRRRKRNEDGSVPHSEA